MPELLMARNPEYITEKKSEKLSPVDQMKGKVEMALSFFGEKRNHTDLYSRLIKRRINSTPSEKLNYAISEAHKKSSFEKTLAGFNGQLSTDPEHVSLKIDKEKISQRTLSRNCIIFSQELKRGLRKVGVDSIMLGNALHKYLQTVVGNENIIIDPTIGQFLEGYNHIFVGTREQLKQLVLEYAQKGKLSYISAANGEPIMVPSNKAEEFFISRWQNSLSFLPE